MSFSAPMRVARALDRLDIEIRRRDRNDNHHSDERDDLLELAHKTRADAELLDVPDLIAVAYSRTAEIHLQRDEVEQALAALAHAMDSLGDLREQDIQVRILAIRAACLARRGDWPAVDQTSADGIAIVERFRYRVSSTYLRSSYLRSRIALYSLGVRAAAEIGNFSTMVERAELSKCRGLIGARSADTGEMATLDRTQLVGRFHTLNQRIERGRERGNVPANLLAERRLLWDLISIATERSHGRRGISGAFTLRLVQARLAPRQAVMYYYWIDRHRLLCLTFDKDNVAVEIKRIDKTRRAELDQLADDVLAIEPGAAMTRVDDVQDFVDVLWPADADAIAMLERANRLIISPHQGLHALPFAALEIKGEYLIQRYAVRLAPNLTSLLLDGPRGGRDQPLLALGIEHYTIPGATWPPLPDAEHEIEDIEALYRAADVEMTALLGTAANEMAFQAMSDDGHLKPARRLHLACHGMNIDADTPMESGLCLATSQLDGVEISLLELDADLVVLSACCSGQRAIGGRGMDELPGDELFGLQAAFFTAGVKEIIASLWPVDSKTARAIGVGLHHYLLDGLPSDIALQRSMCDYLAAAGRLRRKRFYWGPFQLTATGPSLALPEP